MREAKNPEKRVITGTATIISGVITGIFGAGIGALLGSLRDRYPGISDFKNYQKYKGTLQEYSLINEEGTLLHRFKHRFYFGCTMGTSFHIGEFSRNNPVPDYEGMARSGFCGKFFLGYRLNKNLGIEGSMRNYMFNASEDDLDEYQLYWGYDAWLIGPVISLPTSDKFRFDFTTQLGFAKVYLTDERDLVSGHGMGINISGSMVYDWTKRCRISLETGYSTSEQTYKNLGKGNPRAWDLLFGLAYKFGKRSL